MGDPGKNSRYGVYLYLKLWLIRSRHLSFIEVLNGVSFAMIFYYVQLLLLRPSWHRRYDDKERELAAKAQETGWRPQPFPENNQLIRFFSQER